MIRLSSRGRQFVPSVTAHCDWSIDARKRWMALAVAVSGEKTLLREPCQVSDPGNLLPYLEALSVEVGTGGGVLVGFDFPIGFPAAYANQAGISNFLSLLPGLGAGEWSRFFEAALSPEEICLARPFYPLKPGQARLVHLLDGLGLEKRNDLLRVCERGHANRRAACPLFWTMGGQQVGKAALHAWREVLQPALPAAAIWPFSGKFYELLDKGGTVIAETYPAEFYSHLDITFPRARKEGRSGKRIRASRAANAHCFYVWAENAGVEFEVYLAGQIRDGFGSDPYGEDKFDTVVGLCGMLNVVLGFRDPGDPIMKEIRRVEGWIFGQLNY